MVIRTCLLSFPLLFAASTALADETRYAEPDTSVRAERAPDRIAFFGTLAAGSFGREAGSEDGAALGGEVAYLFRGMQGVRVGYAYGAGLFGPEVHLFDLDYSVQWNTSDRLRGVSGSFGGLIGPAVGYVSYGGDDPQVHATFGGRAGVFADLNLWWFVVGADASIRLGMSTNYGAESFASFGVHAGVRFDVARR